MTVGREYSFQAREAGAEREFTLSIANEAFLSHLARCQDGPAAGMRKPAPSQPMPDPALVGRFVETCGVQHENVMQFDSLP